MRNQKTEKWLLGFSVAFLISVVMAGTDWALAIQDKTPLFAVPVVTYKDGGTKVYLGVGYKIIAYSILEGRQDTVFGSWFMAYSNQK